MRKPMRPKKDKKVFRRTAAKSKKININPTVFRGGIRLGNMVFTLSAMPARAFFRLRSIRTILPLCGILLMLVCRACQENQACPYQP